MTDLRWLEGANLTQSLLVGIVVTTIYNLYFHPLARFPGPFLRPSTWVGFYWYQLLGTEHHSIKAAHDKYGKIVRVAPNLITFTDSAAWKDIYGFVQGKRQLRKDTTVVGGPDPPDMLTSDDVNHTRIRKLLSHAFSAEALKEQEPLLNHYLAQLTARLNTESEGPDGGKVDIVRWLNFFAFHLVSDLSFGSPFHSLETGEYHPCVAMIFDSVRQLVLLRAFLQFPTLSWLGNWVMMLNPNVAEAKEKHLGFAKKIVKERLAQTVDRKDFLSFMRRHDDERGVSEEELVGTLSTVVRAGSETSATLVSGALFHLLKDPAIMERLQKEVRGSFKTLDEISVASTSKLKYMIMVIEEALRIYPPVPTVVPRFTQPTGNLIAGHFIPGDTMVGVHHWSASHSPQNFTDPETFDPERSAEPTPEKYANDDFAAKQPFSMGPRVCIGRSLAHAMMRGLLARLIWSYDFELCEESKGWLRQQRVLLLWEKGPLWVRLRRRQGI